MHSVHGLLGQFSPALPMSGEEINCYGINFRKEFLKPYISEEMLTVIFADKADEVKEKYLNPLPEGLYEMLPEYDTQRKVETEFSGGEDEQIKEGLYSLISNVLFVPDNKNPELCHPRISARDDFYFRSLSPHEQWAFTNLYNDYFYRRHNDFWYCEAMKKLPVLLNATRMLVCAEDLGMIPDCVGRVMYELQMLSLEIQRMPKSMHEKFANTRHYPYLSVCTISTHDMPTLRGWWEEDYSLATQFYHEVLHQYDTAPHSAEPDICEQVITQHLQSPSMLCLLSFQDWLSMDGKLRRADVAGERINIPSIPRYYWRYRMHIALEDLMKEEALNEKIKTMILYNGR